MILDAESIGHGFGQHIQCAEEIGNTRTANHKDMWGILESSEIFKMLSYEISDEPLKSFASDRR